MGGVAELIPRALRLPHHAPQRPGNPVMVVLTTEPQATTRADSYRGPQYKDCSGGYDCPIRTQSQTKQTLNKLRITIKLTTITVHTLCLSSILASSVLRHAATDAGKTVATRTGHRASWSPRSTLPCSRRRGSPGEAVHDPGTCIAPCGRRRCARASRPAVSLELCSCDPGGEVSAVDIRDGFSLTNFPWSCS
jgi:hypothetical protein